MRTLAESVELARTAAEDGVTVLAATPHVREDYYGRPLDIGDRIFRLREQGITSVLAHPERNTTVQERRSGSSSSWARARSCMRR